MNALQVARDEWPALDWREATIDGNDLDGFAGHRLVANACQSYSGDWTCIGMGPGIHDAPTLRATLRAARAAMPEHVEHVPRTPLEVARADWPALRWRVAQTGVFVRLRGYDRRGFVVVTASRWDGEGWRVASGDVAWHHCVSLRDGLRRVRWALP